MQKNVLAGFDIGTLKGGIGKVKGMLDDGKLGISESDLFATALIAKDKVVTPGSTVEKITSAAALRAGVATNPYTRTSPKVGRNSPCPCGSGRKFKKCCGA